MGKIAVIDTETTWGNRVMSIGAVAADGDTFRPLDAKYYVLTPEYLEGGMFSNVLFLDSRLAPKVCSREEAMEDLKTWLSRHGMERTSWPSPFPKPARKISLSLFTGI